LTLQLSVWNFTPYFLTKQKPTKMNDIKNIMIGVLLALIVYKLVDTLLLSKIAMFEESYDEMN
jgi:hypothetical protein